MKRAVRLSLLAALLGAGCTSLGPMPATTGISAIPAGRPGGEAQLGMMPAYHLSAAVSDPRGSLVQQLAVTLEPDRLIGLPGLLVGGRVYGVDPDTPVEPFLGYRRAIDPKFAVAAIAFGTVQRASARGASYEAVRAGAEVAADGQLVTFTPWLHLHGQLAFAVTGVSASGTYCIDVADGRGIDCDLDDPARNTTVDGSLGGVYPAGTATLSLDLRPRAGALHVARLGVMATGGLTPSVVGGVQEDARGFFSVGASLTLGFGAGGPSRAAAQVP